MLIAKSRKSDRKGERKGDKKQRERARKRAALLRRVLFSVLIVGVLGVFLYNNRDYFFDAAADDKAGVGARPAERVLGPDAEGGEGAEPKAAAEQKPRPRKPKRAKEALAQGGGAAGGRSVNEVLGGLEFAGEGGGDLPKKLAPKDPPKKLEDLPQSQPLPKPDLVLAPPTAQTPGQDSQQVLPPPPTREDLPKELPKDPPKELAREDLPKEPIKELPKDPPEEPPKELQPVPPQADSLSVAGARPDSSADSAGVAADSAGGGKGLLARFGADRIDRIKGQGAELLENFGADRIKGRGSELLEKLGVGGLWGKGLALLDSWKAGARAHFDGAWAWARSPIDRVDSWARPLMDSVGRREFLERADSLVLRGMGRGEWGAVSDAGGALAAEPAGTAADRWVVGTNLASVVDDRRAIAAASLPAVPKRPLSSLSLPDISCSLGDRGDIRINMSLELLYDDDDALKGELDFKRGTLLAVAGAVVRGYEYGTVNMPDLSEGLLNSFNGQLKSGQLSSVDITEFQVEKYWGL